MTIDINDRLKAIEDRLDMLETSVTTAHNKADELAEFIKKMSDTHTRHLLLTKERVAQLQKFAIEFGETILEHDKALFPERSIERAERLTFVMKLSDKIN